MRQDFLKANGIMSDPDRYLRGTPQSGLANISLINSLGPTEELLQCCFNGVPIKVLADTGSQIDCISRGIAETMDLMMPVWKPVQSVDVTITISANVIKGVLSVGSEPSNIYKFDGVSGLEESSPQTPPQKNPGEREEMAPELRSIEGADCYQRFVDVEFHVIEGLKYDYIVGCRSLLALKAFEDHLDDFCPHEEAKGGRHWHESWCSLHGCSRFSAGAAERTPKHEMRKVTTTLQPVKY
jgi:hypothetical protein